MIRLEDPLWLLLLLLIPPAGFRLFGRRRGVIYSSLTEFPGRRSWRIRLVFLPEVFLLCGLCALVLAAARPVRVSGEIRDIRKGLIMEMVIDRSGSMGTWMDRQEERNRLDVVREVFLDFINGDDRHLSGRADDMIGIISFARFADTLSPLTSSHAVLPRFVETMSLAEGEEDGTSVGDALALAVARIESFRKGLGGTAEDEVPGAVIILLTDGQNNSGRLTPVEAAGLAAERDIRVYTIGFGGGFYRNGFGFWSKIPPEYGVDRAALEEIASVTGGAYFGAEDENSLREIYRTIDGLEKTEIESVSHTEREELFSLFILAGLILIVLGVLLGEGVFPVLEEL